MEIISYVGDRSSHRRSDTGLKKTFSFSKKQVLFSFNGSAGSRTAAKIHTRHLQAVDRKYILERIGFYIECLQKNVWLLLLCGLCAAVFSGVQALCRYADNKARPAVFKSEGEGEDIALLNQAMSDFALDKSESYTANGDLLNDDGTVLKAADINFYQPVTYKTYTVKSGDTIGGIVRKFGLTNLSTIIAVNDIGNVRQLRSGQKLRIPSTDGLLYTVQKGNSLEGISSKFNVTVEDLLDVNDLSSTVLTAGMQLFIPGAKMDQTELSRAMGELFIYPVKTSWRLTSQFGYRKDPCTGVDSHHTGIDMAVATGTPVYAAMSGRIIAAAWSNVYGNYIIIDHQNGYQTLYGHLSKITAVKKQWVSQGTRIGLSGSTGYSTGPHLHFSVYKNGKLMNPLTVLK